MICQCYDCQKPQPAIVIAEGFGDEEIDFFSLDHNQAESLREYLNNEIGEL